MRQSGDAEGDAKRTCGPESPSIGQLLVGQFLRLLSLAKLKQCQGGAGTGVQEAVVVHLQPPGLGAVKLAELLEVRHGLSRTSLRHPQPAAGRERDDRAEVGRELGQAQLIQNCLGLVELSRLDPDVDQHTRQQSKARSETQALQDSQADAGCRIGLRQRP